MTTRLQVSGYRFLLRRMEHALVRGDVRMLDDPLRAQSLSLIAGCVLAVIAIAGCAILAFVRPQGTLGSAPIVVTRESGALYVRIGDTMHPVLNLASARLIAGNPANPEVVGESAITNAKRGSLVGIPGAPATIGNPLDGDESGWTVCDDATTTTVIGGGIRGRPDPGPKRPGHSANGKCRDDLSALRRVAGADRSAKPRRRPRSATGRRCAAACFACDARRNT